jgi:hypothetical protein
MPYVANLFEWQIATMEEIGKTDRAVALKHDARIKGLANTMKNYRGKLLGMKRLHLVDAKFEEEKPLQQFIESDAKRKELYGTVLEDIGKIYREMSDWAPSELVLDYLRGSSVMLGCGFTIYESALELQKPDLERLSSYTERNLANTKRALSQALQNYYEPTDKALLKHMLMQAANLLEMQRIPAIDEILKVGSAEQAIDRFIQTAYAQSKLNDEKIVMDSFGKKPAEVEQMDDPFVRLARALYRTYLKLRETRQRRDGALSKLSALLVDVKQQFQKTSFIPDANSTLRLTFGRIKGYSPADATYYKPITTLTGVIEKNTGEDPYATPEKVIDLYKSKNFGRYRNAKLNDVPVAILYNMDTTGGNSGSPVLNSRGELVGVNFDRAFEATINDYAWSDSYSRSIAVDIRYVLWVTEKVGEANYLLKEMGIK